MQLFAPKTVISAHCDLPCGIYDPAQARLEAESVKACMEKGFLINCIQDSILRLVPPLIVSRDEIDALVNCLDDVFKTGASEKVC